MERVDMNDPKDPVQGTVDQLYKTHYGKIVSALCTLWREIPMESVEDAVQDAFAAALTVWARPAASSIGENASVSCNIVAAGLPSNPPGWIYTVARNRLISLIRTEKRRWTRLDLKTETLPDLATCDPALSPAARTDAYTSPDFSGSIFKDQQLKLLFACAHPDLSPKVQIVITLKYVANLKIDAIARALGMTTDGVDKLLFRARKKIRNERLFLLDPGNSKNLQARLPTVLKIIYLTFNEGYKPSSGNVAVNESLCEEALLLCKDLLDHGFGDGATMALYALMLFNAARFKGRTSPTGELLDLDEQDRSLWNRPMIAMAADFLHRSRPLLQRDGPLTSYHFEAAIAWLHCTAGSLADTNWRLISRLYLRVLRMNPNPFVELNYAIALYYAGGKEKSFELMQGLLKNPFMNGYYLLNAALGKLYLLEGDIPRAKKYLERTLEQTEHPLETAFILRLLSRFSPPATPSSDPRGL
jgi:RNA polymerase sigma-70 factor (ECF subfamily)